jgi:hypothetical protein
MSRAATVLAPGSSKFTVNAPLTRDGWEHWRAIAGQEHRQELFEQYVGIVKTVLRGIKRQITGSRHALISGTATCRHSGFFRSARHSHS